MDLTWTNVLTLAATTGVFTTLLNQGVGLLREWRVNKSRKKSEATYLAMRLAVILEEFAVKCVYRAWHDEAELKEGAIEFDYSLPALAPYPQDSDWKSLDHKLAGQVLSFPNEISSAEMSCQFQAMREGYRIASTEETIVAGDNAWRLAQSLRKKYNLGVISIFGINYLTNAHKKIKERRETIPERENSLTSP